MHTSVTATRNHESDFDSSRSQSHNVSYMSLILTAVDAHLTMLVT